MNFGYVFKCISMHYFFLWRFALLRFFRLCVATLCRFPFLPLGIVKFKFVFVNNFYATSTFDLTPLTNTLAGLKAGMLCAGILTATFFEIFLPVFSARVLIIKLPNPRRYTFCLLYTSPSPRD